MATKTSQLNTRYLICSHLWTPVFSVIKYKSLFHIILCKQDKHQLSQLSDMTLQRSNPAEDNIAPIYMDLSINFSLKWIQCFC